MEIAGIVFANFRENFLGGEPLLRAAVAGHGILERTLRRLMRVEGLARRALLVSPPDESTAADFLNDSGLSDGVDLLVLDGGHRPRRGLLRCARKWALDAWRGGLLGSTWFDEFLDAPSIARVLDHYGCDGVYCVEGHCPLLDPQISSALVAHQRERPAEAKFSFTQAPPGLCGVIVRREFAADMLKLDLPLGLFLAYRPEMPQGDPITRAPCMMIDARVAPCGVRFAADTRRSRERVERVLGALGQEASAADVCAWVSKHEHGSCNALPRELEIELTTDDPLPDTTLRPRGARVPRRMWARLDDIERIARELATYDDSLVVLGGHGDPLLHPQFAEVCASLRSAGVCGIAVTSSLVDMPAPAAEALFASAVDVLEVRLDANSPETFRTLHKSDHYETVVANIERLEVERRRRGSPAPLIVPSLTRAAGTLSEMEAFYDRWIPVTGAAVIRGYSDFGGLLPPDPLIRSTPPIRRPCAQLERRMVLLADGSFSLCDQDFEGALRVGDSREAGVEAAWTSAGRRQALARHRSVAVGDMPKCEKCTEWHRP